MQQQNIPIGTLVDMYKRGEMRLPEIQRHYVWRATRVRDLLDSLYRGYPSGSILMWETDEPVSVRNRKRPIDILFDLDHPDGPPRDVLEVQSDEDTLVSDDEVPDEDDEADDGEQGIQEKLNQRTFVVASRNLSSQSNWVSVSEVFKNAKEGLRFAINFLRANAGIEDESLLSSPMFIHSLAAISFTKNNKLTGEEQHALLHWLLVANARGRYSRGSTEGLLNEDLAIIFRTGDVLALMEPLKRQFGRLHIEPSDLAGRGVNSPLFSLAYLALKAGGAKDWYSGLGLSLTHQGRLHFVQWHHIIPKSLLKSKSYETGEINEIANMAFITGQTNRRISNKDAVGYLADIVKKQGESALTSQCVPTDSEVWSTDRYREFLQLRRDQLAARMNDFIKEKAGL